MQIRITYYASNAGQQAVPVILLHDYNETRAVFEPLAAALQNPPPGLAENLPPSSEPIQPRAAVTVDLRGHGESKTAFDADGLPVELDAAAFEVEDFRDMVRFDLEAVRSFLVDQNDAGRLNLNKLCVVGAGMGANVAVLWAANDWATPPLAVRKQGQDVKALVLLSPRWNYRGLSLVEAMKFPPIQQRVPTFLAYGAGDAKVAKDCENIARILSRYHPEPPADRVAFDKDFFIHAPQTTRQGTKLLTSADFGLTPAILEFVEMRLARRDYLYVPRRVP